MTFGSGEVGQTFVFDGMNSYVDLGSPTNLELQDFTIEGWIQRYDPAQASLNGSYGVIFSWGQNGYGVGLWNDGRLFLTKAFVGNQDFFVGLTDTSQFHHVAITKSGTTIIAYLDGVAFTAPPFTATFTFETSVSIGAGGVAHDSPFYGAIDELSVYNRALSSDEIEAIYVAGSVGKCDSGDPIITTQPKSQSVLSGETVTFNVSALGNQPLIYQWYFNDTNIIGATNSILVLTNVQLAQAGKYSVVVANTGNPALSDTAVLTVLPPPPCMAATSNVISWWPGESNGMDNFGGANGFLTNGMAFTNAEVGNGFLCNGSNSAVQLGNPVNLQLQNFTVEAWVKRFSSTASSLVTPNASIISYGTGGWGFGVWNDGRLLLTRAGVNNIDGFVGFTDTSAFHHIAVTKSNTTVVFYYDGKPFPVGAYSSVFTFTTNIAIGAEGDNYGTGFYGIIDELTVYNRALSTTEITNIFNAGRGGKCYSPFSPSIAIQPISQTVAIGGSATFTVGAIGASDLSYQWMSNQTTIIGATNSSLTVTNVQPTAGISYSVQVSNSLGQVLSSNAVLSVSPVVQIISTTVDGGSAVVPINILAGGNENSLQFSVSYATNLLTYTGAMLGSNDISGSILAITNQLPSGRVGIFILLPGTNTLSPGTQQVARILFNASARTNTVSTAISFGDAPAPRQIADSQGISIPATYSNATVIIPTLGFEGDLAPRTNGDSIFAIADWQQVGRFVAGLDFPTNNNEFQRADTAPRSSLGNGLLTVADWVQTLRYVTGADSMSQGGGPTKSAAVTNPVPSGARILSASTSTVSAGQSCQISVQLNSQGNEDAIGYSIAFDPTTLSFTSATAGSGAASATLLVNTTRATNGVIGIALELPFLATFPPGVQEVTKLNFMAMPNAGGNTTFSFTNQPVLLDTADANATSLPISYQGGTFSVSNPLLNLSAAAQANGKLVLSWSAVLNGYNLESNTNLASTNWVIVSGLNTNSGTVSVTNSTSAGRMFYRLHHP